MYIYTYTSIYQINLPIYQSNYKMLRKPFFRKNKVSPEEQNVCSICLDGFDKLDEKLTTQCHHHFHHNCITRAIVRDMRCPNCRTPMNQFDIRVGNTGIWEKILNTYDFISKTIEELDVKFSTTLEYMFNHHLFVALVVVIPVGYIYLTGYAIVCIGKLVTKLVTWPFMRGFEIIYPE